MRKVWEVWNEIIERLPGELTRTAQVVNRVNHFLFNFEAGDWLYNLSPLIGTGEQWTDLRETAECFAAVGAPNVAQRLMDIVSIVESSSVQTFGTWNDYLATVDPSRTVDQIAKSISEEIPGLWDKLREYTLGHFECEPD